MKKKKEFVSPIGFELILRHRDQDVLLPVIHWLLKNNAPHSFQWERIMLEKEDVYELSIQTSWSDNLAEIAYMCGDYGQE